MPPIRDRAGNPLNELGRALRGLLHEQRIAALGTLHGGEPYVSMVPFAIVASRARFAIHVSALAAHTKDMREDPRVSLLVVAARREDVAPQATARVTIQGDAQALAEGDPRRDEARRIYLARFPESEPMFGFTDFSLFEVAPRAIRFVAGFAQAKSLTPEAFAEILRA